MQIDKEPLQIRFTLQSGGGSVDPAERAGSVSSAVAFVRAKEEKEASLCFF